MIVVAQCGLPPEDVVLEPLAVGRLVGGAVLKLLRLDGDLGGKAGTELVGHDQDHIGVWDQLDTEWSIKIRKKRYSQASGTGNVLCRFM